MCSAFLGVTVDGRMSLVAPHRAAPSWAVRASTNAIEMIHTVDEWYAQQFAYLVGKLDSIVEGDTHAPRQHRDRLVATSMSDGNSPQPQQPADPPGGELRGYFKVGQAVNVEGGKTDMTRRTQRQGLRERAVSDRHLLDSWRNARRPESPRSRSTSTSAT